MLLAGLMSLLGAGKILTYKCYSNRSCFVSLWAELLFTQENRQNIKS